MIEHVNRGLASSGRPLISAGDVRLAATLPVLGLAARILAEERWSAFCRSLTTAGATRGTADAVRAFLAASSEPLVDPVAVAREVASARLEHFMQALRAAGRKGEVSPTRLSGLDNLQTALAAERGAVLWVAHFAFAPLASKTALAAAGYRVWHMSRPEHGFSKTRFGIRVLNPVRWRAEKRHLSGRIIIDRRNPAAATLKASRLLAANGIVSITAGDWEGARVLQVPFGAGTVGIANGAPALAHLAGAPLLGVVAVRDRPGSPIEVVLLPSMTPDRSVSRAAWVDTAAARFAELVYPYIVRYPGQWRDWHRWQAGYGGPGSAP